MNDRFPYFDVPIYMAGSYDQFLAQIVVDPIRPAQNLDQTVEFEKWSKYKNLSAKSVENTFKYIFYKFKKGIFVQIRNNNVVTFLPFSNENYVNELSFKIKVDAKKYKNILELINKIQVLKNYKPILKLKPINKWTMNDPLVRYDTPKKIALGHHVLTIKHMLEKLCEQEPDVPDVDFFINSRDFPLLKEDDTEPYQHILGTSRHPLISHNYSSYCPILSMVTSYKYTDIPIPTYECWIRAWCTETETAVNSQPFMEPIKLQTPWDNKLSKAVFRGSSTGAGVTIETNQRLKVCLKLAKERPDLIDAGITKWNLRPRKYKGSKYLETIELDAYHLANFLTPQQQADNYKYILCLEGHVAAFRLSRELTYGAVVMLPETAYDLWFMTYLKPWIHYVPVKHDCSDLIEKITWCIKHDNKCKLIVENALNFVAQNLNVNETFKYLKSVFNQITGHYQYFNPIMYVDRITKNYFESLSFIVKDFPYNIPDMFRTAGYLDGTRLIFEGCPKMRRLKLLTQTNFMTETLYSFNNIKCVKRTYYNIALTHYEAYIGLHAINKCCSKIPNFTYVYGILPMDPKSVYLEYIDAPTLKEWLNSPKFSKTELINIICQLTCALKEAEMTAGIRHFNLSIETVKILSVEQPIQLNYHDGKSNSISITVQNIAIIDYYYRASAVIYYKEIDGPLILQQCDFENTSSSNSDIIGLIIEIPYLKNIISLTVGTFGSHWNYKHKALDPIKLAAKYKLTHVIKYLVGPYKSLTVFGPLPYYVYALAEKGHHNLAIDAVLQNIIKKPPPRSNNAFLQSFIHNIISTRFAWTIKFGMNHTKIYNFLTKQPQAITGFPELVWPSLSELGPEQIGFPKYQDIKCLVPQPVNYFEPSLGYNIVGPIPDFIDILFNCCVKNLLIKEVKAELIQLDPWTLHYLFANYQTNYRLTRIRMVD